MAISVPFFCIGVRALSDLGGGGGDFLARNYAMPESVRVEIGMQTQMFTIFASNETAIIGKIVKLKACILNSINSLNIAAQGKWALFSLPFDSIRFSFFFKLYLR